MTRTLAIIGWLKSNRQQPHGDFELQDPRSLKIVLLLLAAVLLLAMAALVPTVLAQGLTLTVNVSTDGSDIIPGDGICDSNGIIQGDQCSLRAAIEELNQQDANETHRIVFNLAGSGPFTIAPASPLPVIEVPIEINGASQSGASCPTANAPANLLIVLDGSNLSGLARGLDFGDGSTGSTVRGLVVGNFWHGLVLESDGNTIVCNHIGVGADGVSEMGNDYFGIVSYGAFNQVGGATAAARNVISANGNAGVRLNLYDSVAGNFVGTTADGMSALGNETGIVSVDIYNLIGLTQVNEERGNVVSGNTENGIDIENGFTVLVWGNYVGVARDGHTPLPNGGHGIAITANSWENYIGDREPGRGNTIAYNGGDGVMLDADAGGNPTSNEIAGNAIFANGGLGIDLDNDGVDTNDDGDGDGGENYGQNYPILTASPGSLTISGTLGSLANRTYTIDLYRSAECDPTGYGEGRQWLAAFDVTTDGDGYASFDATVSGVQPGDSITATASDDNTSEFSACVSLDYEPAGTATHTPTTTATPTSTATEGPSPTSTHTATLGPSPTATATATEGPSPTATASATEGPSPTPTHTVTPGPSPTATATATEGPSPTPTATGAPLPQGAFVTYLPLIKR